MTDREPLLAEPTITGTAAPTGMTFPSWRADPEPVREADVEPR